MPPLPSPGKVIRCGFEWTAGSGLTLGTRFFVSYSSGTPTQANINQLSAEIGTLYGTDLKQLCPSNYELIASTALDLSSSSGFFGTTAQTINGTRTGTALPLGTPTTVDYLIARRYRGGKPRGYFPFGVTSDLADEAHWNGTFTGAVNTAYGTFMAALLAYTGDSITKVNHVNVSWYEGFTNYTGSGGRAKVRANLRGTPVVDVVTTHDARPTLGSQRRRLGV